MLALCLFAAAILVYTHARTVLPLLVFTLAVIGFAVVRAWFWPDSFALRVALEVSYRIVALAPPFS